MSILSIQSHVSYGHVGNAAGVFILQRSGFDVWPVHTVLFSNHPGYGDFRGRAVEPAMVSDIIAGIEARGMFLHCEAIMGGYLGKAETGDAMLSAVARVKQANPDSIFFCDPVMGDREKGLYVSDDIVLFYKERGMAAADILKPNAYELEVLAGQPVTDPQTACAAARHLIKAWNLRAVVVSSVPVPVSACDGAAIACMAITGEDAWSVETPLLPVEQKGAGDAFMALYVAKALRSGMNHRDALEGAASAIWSVMNVSAGTEQRELPLIAEQGNFDQPSHLFKAMALNPVLS